VAGCATPLTMPAAGALSGVTTARRNIGAFAPITTTFLQATGDTSDTTTYTFAAQDFGAEDATRTIAVVITARSATAQSVSSVSIGGVTATLVTTTTGDASVAAIAYAAVPTGATGAVVVTFSGSMVRCAIGLYRLVGGSVTATGASGETSATVTAAAGGCVVAGGYASAYTAAWTGVTKNWEFDIEPPGRITSGGSAATPAAGSIAVSVNWDTGGGSFRRMVAAAFTPTTELSI